MPLILLISILAAWTLFAIIPAGKLAIEDSLNEVPKDKRRGVSILPAIILFPLPIWGATLFLSHWISDKVFSISLFAHLTLILIFGFIIFRDVRLLRYIKKTQTAEQDAAANP